MSLHLYIKNARGSEQGTTELNRSGSSSLNSTLNESCETKQSIDTDDYTMAQEFDYFEGIGRMFDLSSDHFIDVYEPVLQLKSILKPTSYPVNRYFDNNIIRPPSYFVKLKNIESAVVSKKQGSFQVMFKRPIQTFQRNLGARLQNLAYRSIRTTPGTSTRVRFFDEVHYFTYDSMLPVLFPFRKHWIHCIKPVDLHQLIINGRHFEKVVVYSDHSNKSFLDKNSPEDRMFLMAHEMQYKKETQELERKLSKSGSKMKDNSKKSIRFSIANEVFDDHPGSNQEPKRVDRRYKSTDDYFNACEEYLIKRFMCITGVCSETFTTDVISLIGDKIHQLVNPNPKTHWIFEAFAHPDEENEELAKAQTPEECNRIRKEVLDRWHLGVGIVKSANKVKFETIMQHLEIAYPYYEAQTVSFMMIDVRLLKEKLAEMESMIYDQKSKIEVYRYMKKTNTNWLDNQLDYLQSLKVQTDDLKKVVIKYERIIAAYMVRRERLDYITSIIKERHPQKLTASRKNKIFTIDADKTKLWDRINLPQSLTTEMRKNIEVDFAGCIKYNYDTPTERRLMADLNFEVIRYFMTDPTRFQCYATNRSITSFCELIEAYATLKMLQKNNLRHKDMLIGVFLQEKAALTYDINMIRKKVVRDFERESNLQECDYTLTKNQTEELERRFEKHLKDTRMGLSMGYLEINEEKTRKSKRGLKKVNTHKKLVDYELNQLMLREIDEINKQEQDIAEYQSHTENLTRKYSYPPLKNKIPRSQRIPGTEELN